MSPTSAPRVRREDGPGHVLARLDRPEQRNAIDAALLEGLSAALDDAERTPGNRVFALASTGPDFCSGMDLAGEPAGPTGAADLPYWRLLRRLATSPLVTVALVDGPAIAGGVGLAAACDLVFAGATARFRLTETLLGLLPAMALPFVARRTGEQPAFRLALTTTELDAGAAKRIGLADDVAESAQGLLRPVLVSTRRVERGAVAALKQYRDEAFPAVRDASGPAQQAFLARAADPAVRRRVAELRGAGVLR